MKIREFFYYYLRGTKFCPTAINSANSGCVKRIKPLNRLTQVHILVTRYSPLQTKSGRRDRETKFRQNESRDFQTKKKSEIWTSINESNKI